MSEILKVAREIANRNAEANRARVEEEKQRQEKLEPFKIIGAERAEQFVGLMQENKIPTIKFVDKSTGKELAVYGWGVQNYIEYGRGEQLGYAVLEDCRVVAWDGWFERRSIRNYGLDVSEVLAGDSG